MLSDFKKLTSARFLFTFGVQMQAVIMGWRMYDLTHDPLALGMIGLVGAVPALGLAIFAGYIVDQSRPVHVYRWVLLGSFLSACVLFTSQLSNFNSHAHVLGLYLAAFITGAARSFAQPSIFAIVPRIVPRDQLPRASAWMSSAMQVARISGPALGGVIFGWFGVVTASVSICIFLILAIVSVSLVKAAPAAPTFLKPGHSIRAELFSGVSFVFKHPILISALSLDMISVLFGGVTAVLPIYAAEVLFTGPKGLGVLRAAPAVGAVVASIFLTRVQPKEEAGKWLLSCVAGFGICILVFAISRNFILSLIALAFSGGFDGVSMVIRSSAVQLASPDEMRGRISAVNSIFISSSNELGEFESGVAAKFLGLVPSVLFGGVMCLATVTGVAFISKSLRKMNLEQI